MGASDKIKFELRNKFEPCFTSRFPLLLTNRNKLFCGRSNENSIDVNILDGSSLYPTGTLKDDDCITSFIVNPSDSTLIYSTRSMLLKLIDINTLKVIKTWKSCHQRPVLKMAIQNSSTRLATGSGDTVVRIWHIGPREGFCACCRGHSGMITLLQFHPTHGYLFSSALGDHHVAVWNTENGNRVATLDGHQANVTCIAFSRDDEGRVITTCGRDKVMILWSCHDFSRQSVIPAFESLEACVFLPKGALINHLGNTVDCQELLLTGGQWGCLRVWQPNTGRCLLEIKGPLDRTAQGQKDRRSIDYGLHSIISLQLVQTQLPEENADSAFRLVLTRQSNHIEFYNPLTVRLISEGLGDIGQVDQLCIVGKAHNYLLLADASPQLKLFLQPYGLKSLPDGANEAHAADRSWRCHLIPGGHTDVITDISVSACGLWVVTGSKDQSLCVWQVVEPDSDSRPTETTMARAKLLLVERLKSAHAAHLCAVGLSRSATALLSAAEDNILKLWSLNVSTNRPPNSSEQHGISEVTAVPGAHSATINSIDVSVNSQLAATASRDKTVKIWKLGNCNLEYVGVLQGHRRGVWSVRFSTREKLVLTASGDGDIKLWNLKDFSCIRTLEGHDQPVYKAVFLSQDRQVLSCDQRGLVRLWNLSKPSSYSAPSFSESTSISATNDVYEAHKGRIWSLVVCPDESGFYTGGEDETLCYFQDVTDEIQHASTKKLEDFIQTQQALDNLVNDNRMSEALCLAIRLDQPKRTLDILQKLMMEEKCQLSPAEEETKNSSSTPYQLPRLTAALDGLLLSSSTSDEAPSENARDTACPYLVKRLLTYVVNWNTRAGTCLPAQRVLNWLLTHWSPDKLFQWPGMARTIESLLPYTVRHYQRICRLQEQLAVVDYLCDLVDEHLVTALVDDTESHLPSLQGHRGSSESAEYLSTFRGGCNMPVNLNVDTSERSLYPGRGGNPDIIIPEF